MCRFLEVADYTSAQSPITLIISSLFKAHPSQSACLLHIKTHPQRVVMTYMARPTHFSLMQLSYEHASQCLSSLLLMWIYLFLWKWWEGVDWHNCLQWLLCSLQMTRTKMTTSTLCPSRQPGWQDLWASRAHPPHKTHCLRADRSACPCFIDLVPHKFTTSAFLVLHLTGPRFSEGMRSDRGRGMKGKGRGRGKNGEWVKVNEEKRSRRRNQERQ